MLSMKAMKREINGGDEAYSAKFMVNTSSGDLKLSELLTEFSDF